MAKIPLPASPPLVVGDGVVLRGLRRDTADAAALREIFADAEVRAWLWEFDGTDAVIDQFLSGHEASWRTGAAADFGVSRSVHEPLLALIRMHTLLGDTAKLAWISAPSARGLGVARLAAVTAVNWARDTLGLATLFAEIEPSNVASVRLAEAVGFQRTGRPGTGVRPDGIAAPDELFALEL